MGLDGVAVPPMAGEKTTDGMKKWSILWHRKRFIFWCIYASLGSIMLGFDLVLPGGILAMQDYGYFFNETAGYVVPATWQSLWAATTAIGQVCGGALTGPLSERYGRKLCFLLGALFSIIGVALQLASTEWKLLCAGKAINGVGIGFCFTFAPLYIGENAFPLLRGVFLVCFNATIVWGQFFVVITTQYSNNFAGKLSYRLPIGLQFVFPALMIGLYPFFPESPYYLVNKRKDLEKARKALIFLYGSHHSDFAQEEVDRLMKEGEQNQQLADLGRGLTFRDCFRGTNGKRTMIAVGVTVAQQLVGATFVLGYLAYFLQLVGATGVFTLTSILFVVSIIANTLSFWTIEAFGRRVFIVPGLAVLATLLLLIGIMGSVGTKPALTAIVAFIFLWAAVYQLSIGALGFALASEVTTLALRDHTQSMITVSHSAVAWVFSFTVPYMINPDSGNLGGKVGYVFGALATLCAVWAFFFVPETKGATFDEMDLLFSRKVSPRHFAREVRALHSERPAELELGIKNAAVDDYAEHVEVTTK